MQVGKAKKIASGFLNVGKNRVWVNPEEMQKVAEAMTRQDIKELIASGAIKKKKQNFQSSARAKKLREKKKRGRKGGMGKRKGTKKTRVEKKRRWIKNVRAQRKMLAELKKKENKKIQKIGYAKLYRLVKGNYFRGKKYVEAFVMGTEKGETK